MSSDEKRKFDYRHIICILITIGFTACGVFLFPNALGRLIESGRDFGLSVACYFCELLRIPYGFAPTVNDYAQIPFFPFLQYPQSPVTPDRPLPDTWDGFKSDFTLYWQLWASKDNVIGYGLWLGNALYYLCYALLILLPFALLFRFLLSRYFKKQNNDYDKDSKPLRAFKRFAAHVYRPAKSWFIGLFGFIKERKGYWASWLVMWLFYFNAFTIVIEFIAFYLYFIATFDLLSVYRQVYKLSVDLAVPFKFIPVWVWIIVALVLFDRFRKKIGYDRLHHFEMRNRGFINARPVVFMVCGTMGKKKTTAITDMALSQESMLRDKAFEKILENDLKFPYFPWVNLENGLKRVMARHVVYNLATVRKWVVKKALRWHNNQTRERLFDYDYARYGLTYNDKLKVVNVWDVIMTYAQLYFVYVIQSSLLISNFSIRVDNLFADLGNFPLWNSDFFRRDSRLMDAYSRHAHIVDMDSLRLGLKMVKNNRCADSFEFGVVVITEVGKERGNKVELSEIKRKSEDANQKNDGFNTWLKMVRHSATVDNFPFVRVITDEQRPESWGADARDLCEIIHIRDSGETRLAMPFFSLAELLYGRLYGKFSGLYYRYRYVRSDNTLFMYLLKGLTAKIRRYYTGIYNAFGYCALRVQVESGTQDGQLSDHEYYLMTKKIYSRRFSTDCFSDFFTEKVLRSPVGINDLPEYETEKATFGELRLQNSYFITDLFNGLNSVTTTPPESGPDHGDPGYDVTTLPGYKKDG